MKKIIHIDPDSEHEYCEDCIDDTNHETIIREFSVTINGYKITVDAEFEKCKTCGNLYINSESERCPVDLVLKEYEKVKQAENFDYSAFKNKRISGEIDIG